MLPRGHEKDRICIIYLAVMSECSISTSDLEVTREPTGDNRLPEVDSNVRDDIDKEATLADSQDDAESYVSSVTGMQPICSRA